MNVSELLDRPIAYHRVFVTLTGSVKAAIMLSQALYWQKRAKQKDGFWYKTTEEWEEETGLTRREQETARKDCAKYLKSDLRDSPARLYWKVDEKALSTDLIQFGGKRQTEIGENVQTSLAESDEQVSTKTPNINRNAEITTETTTKFGNLFSEVNALPYCDYPDDVREMCFEFCKLYHFTAPDKPKRRDKSQFSFWILSLTELQTAAGEFGIDALREQRRDFESYMSTHNGVAPFTVSSPQSLVNVVRGKAAQMREPNFKGSKASVPAINTQAVESTKQMIEQKDAIRYVPPPPDARPIIKNLAKGMTK